LPKFNLGITRIMKYYILSTTGFIRNKEKTLHCEQYTHFTRSLNSFLYLFSKIVLVPRKRVRGSAGGHFCQRANQFSLIWGKPTILSYHQMCFLFSLICVRSSLKIFSQIHFFNLLFLRTKRYQERDLGLIIRPVLSWFWL